MSTTQLALGSAFLVLLGTAFVDLITPAPPPIVVHDLHFADGIIHQDRTVIAEDGDAAFFANWSAKFVDVATGEPVCEGSGSWPYQPGRSKKPIPYREWVGDPECVLMPGTYIPVAAWNWGYAGTSHQGEPFTITAQ